ncbi:hypothetical protein [Treponema zioleckii]|uniref:hypothetical protein n=1 Tax=Treponema zioleckii TaxID=331680 RepID=UPI00168A5C55|nr:hypothetical protein [Treponema zioleckii]
MKKLVLLFCSAQILFNASCSSNKKVGSTVRKTVTAEGKTYVKNLKISEWNEFDAQGRKICTKCNGSEFHFDYDETGTKMHTTSFLSSEKISESWSELDSKGNKIYFKNSGGYEEWYEYTFWQDGTVKTKTTYTEK